MGTGDRYVCICVDRTEKSDTLVFWKKDRRGYTDNLNEAGLYWKEEATEICKPQHGFAKHLMIPVHKIHAEAKIKRSVDRDSFGFFERVEKARQAVLNSEDPNG